MMNDEGRRVRDAEAGDGAVAVVARRPREFVVWGLLVALFVGARVWRLDASCLWFDEVFSVHAARHEWGALFKFVALDLVHPPLYYLLLKGWLALVGDGAAAVWWLRLSTVLTATAGVVPFLLLCRELRVRDGAARLALLLWAVNGYLIQHGQQLRMYSLLLLFAFGSLWLFARFSDPGREVRRRDALWLFIVNLLLVYTHYFGWLLVGLEAFYLVIRQRRKLKAFAVVLCALGACFSPWAVMVLGAASEGTGLAQNIGWAARPHLSDILQPFLLLHEPFRFRRNTFEPIVLRVNVWLAVALFVPAFVTLGWRALRQRRRASVPTLEDDTARETARGDTWGKFSGAVAGEGSALTFLLFFSLLPVVVAFVLSRVLPQSIWGLRHLIIIAPAYLLLAASALVSLRPLWLATTIKLLLACWLTLAAMLWLVRRDAPPIWCAWETLARRVVESDAPAIGAAGGGGTSAVKVYAAEELVAYHLWYGMSAVGDERFRVAVVKNLPGLSEDKAFFLPRGFYEVEVADASAALREEHFWVAFRDTTWNAEHPLLRLLSERGYETEPPFEITASGQKAFVVSARRRAR